MKDLYQSKGQRKRMIETIRKKGLNDEKVLDAMGGVPRHLFVPKGSEEWAYRDQAFPIGHDQTISQPYTVAFETSLLEIEKGDKVLEVGTGSGYQAAVLAEMGAEVHSIERKEALYKTAKNIHEELEYSNIHLYYGDGYKGIPSEAPFDKILFTARIEKLPESVKEQLKDPGIIVAPVGPGEIQEMRKYVLKGGRWDISVHGHFRFVPCLRGVDE